MLLRDSIEVTRTGFEEEEGGGREQDTRTMVADGDLNCFHSLYTRVAKETTGLSRPKRITTTTTTDAANPNDSDDDDNNDKGKDDSSPSLTPSNKCPSSQKDREKIFIDLSSSISIPVVLQNHLNLSPRKLASTTLPIQNPNTMAYWRRNGRA